MKDDLAGPVSKLGGEFYIRCFHEAFGLETLILRYFNVFGPRRDPSSPYSGVLARRAKSERWIKRSRAGRRRRARLRRLRARETGAATGPRARRARPRAAAATDRRERAAGGRRAGNRPRCRCPAVRDGRAVRRGEGCESCTGGRRDRACVREARPC